MLAAIAQNGDFAEICFLVALIIFIVVAVIHGLHRSLEACLLAVGLAAVAWGLLAL